MPVRVLVMMTVLSLPIVAFAEPKSDTPSSTPDGVSRQTNNAMQAAAQAADETMRKIFADRDTEILQLGTQLREAGHALLGGQQLLTEMQTQATERTKQIADDQNQLLANKAKEDGLQKQLTDANHQVAVLTQQLASAPAVGIFSEPVKAAPLKK